MQSELGQYIPPVAHTRVKLLTNIKGGKEINGQWVDHPLPAGTIVFIRERESTRTSINTDPLSAEDFVYKLEAKIKENVPQENLEGPYVGHNDGQKIRHTALDSDRCQPVGPYGMFDIGQRTYIRQGNQYTYGFGSGVMTLKPGDMVEILAEGTTKSGSKSVMIADNAYYLKVYKVKRFIAPAKITWRSKRFVSPDKFEVVHDV